MMKERILNSCRKHRAQPLGHSPGEQAQRREWQQRQPFTPSLILFLHLRPRHIMHLRQTMHQSSRPFLSCYRLVLLIVATETLGEDVPLMIIRYITRVLQRFVIENQ
jgi:hypothetical protein